MLEYTPKKKGLRVVRDGSSETVGLTDVKFADCMNSHWTRASGIALKYPRARTLGTPLKFPSLTAASGYKDLGKPPVSTQVRSVFEVLGGGGRGRGPIPG